MYIFSSMKTLTNPVLAEYVMNSTRARSGSWQVVRVNVAVDIKKAINGI